MFTHIRHLSFLLLTFSLSLPLSAKELTRVDIRELSEHSHALAGQRVTTHGCLTANIHGDFIEPCGNHDWRKIVLAYDATNNVIYPAFKRLHINFASQLEGDFTGVMEEEEVNWPKPGKRMFIQLQTIARAKRHEP